MTRKISSALLFCFLLQFFCVSNLYARDDWQYWSKFALEANYIEDLTLKVGGELRLRDDFSELALANVETILLYQPIKYLEFGPLYKFESAKSPSGKRIHENRYGIEATGKVRLWKLGLSDRNRVEYRNKSGDDSWRYRNRIQLTYPINIRKIRLTPYASEELFYDEEVQELNQNRVTLGFSVRLYQYLGIQLYYRLQSRRQNSSWNHNHILGTALKIYLGK